MTRRRKGKPEPASQEQLDRLKGKFKRAEIGSHGPPAAEDNPRRRWKPKQRINRRGSE